MDLLLKPDRNRRMYFFAHHRKALSDDLVRRVIRECGPKTPPAGQAPYTEEDRERWLRNLKERQYLSHIGLWDFPFVTRVGDRAVEARVAAPLVLRQSSHVVSMSREIHIPAMVADDRHWISVKTNGPTARVTDEYAVEWFFDRIRPTIPIFEPDFAFADNDLAIMQNLDGKDVEPKDLAWPLMIFGPKAVKKLEKETLMEAPAWKVSELPYGGIWVQAAENPFTVKSKVLQPLAKHLGLEPRSLRE